MSITDTDDKLKACEYPGCTERFHPARKDSRLCVEHKKSKYRKFLNGQQAEPKGEGDAADRGTTRTHKSRRTTTKKKRQPARRPPLPATAPRPATGGEEGLRPGPQASASGASLVLPMSTELLIVLLRQSAAELERLNRAT